MCYLPVLALSHFDTSDPKQFSFLWTLSTLICNVCVYDPDKILKLPSDNLRNYIDAPVIK